MATLSALTFTCNDEKLTRELVRNVGSVADEIVIIDSSDVPMKRERMPFPKKVRIFHSKRLGYPEPFKPYGISKCKGDWILFIYTDERLSPGLKRDIRGIIEANSKTLVLSLKRYDNWSLGTRSHYSWQNVLGQNKPKQLDGIKGNIHEIMVPRIKGQRVKRLNQKDHYVMHLEKEEELHLEYNKLNQLMRVSYGDLQRKSGKGSTVANVAMGILDLYLKGKKSEDELGKLDYYAYFLAFHLKQFANTKNIRRLTQAFPQRMREIDMYKAEPNSDILFKAIKEAQAEGVAYYLGMSNEEGIRRLSKHRENGTKLLFKLILDEYSRRHRLKIVN